MLTQSIVANEIVKAIGVLYYYSSSSSSEEDDEEIEDDEAEG